jgi:uncharacterized surface protein with fasciclin (FAS1) repeats
MRTSPTLANTGSMFNNVTQSFTQSAQKNVGRLAIACLAAITLGACASSNNASDTTQAEEVATQPAAAPKETLVPTDTTPVPPSTDDVFTTVEATAKYPTFVKLVNQAGLAETLRTGGPFTIAIPSEEAFAALPAETLTALTADTAELARVLKYHVVPAIVTPDPAASGPAPTLEGSSLDVVFTETNTTINGANVLTAPRATANGAFIAIDKVLLPPKK